MAASKRKPNWASDELDALAQAVSENLLTIKGKFSPGLSNAQKMKCWESITERINAVNVSGVRRETSEVKKKWLDVSSTTKKKEASRLREQRMTGGGTGPTDDLKSWEKVIVSCLTKSSVEGVSGGVDTLEGSSETTNMYAGGDQAEMVSSGSTQETAIDKYLPSTGTGSESVVLPTVMSSGACSSVTEKECGEIITKKKRKIIEDNSTQSIQKKFLKMEEEKQKELYNYRTKKLELYKQMVDQQEEMLKLQRRSVTALELLALKVQGQSDISSFSLSPVINFHQ